LFELDCHERGFEWIDCNDSENSVVSFLRQGRSSLETLLVVCNFTPVTRQEYRIGAPSEGFWREVLNSDADAYGGSQQGNWGGVEARPEAHHGRSYSLSLTLPPLAILFFKHESGGSRSTLRS
jgi:1,4-alpha-glucan branching enzyme